MGETMSEPERIDRIIAHPGSILSSILKGERTERTCIKCGAKFNALWATICEECSDKIRAGQEEADRLAAEAEAAQYLKEITRNASIPTFWQDTRFETSVPTIHPELLEQAKKYTADFSVRSPSLLFHGKNVGAGKTHLAVCIANEVLHEKHIPVLYLKARDMLINLRGLYTPGSETSERDYLNRVLSIPLLVLDDVGRDNPTEWTDGTYWTIFDRRLEAQLPTIITTNKSPHDVVDNALGDRIGYPALSRLLSMCAGLVFEVGGQDLR